jgi:hypothetical protein
MEYPLQYYPAFKLPHGNAAFGERRLPENVTVYFLSTDFEEENIESRMHE